MSLNKLLGISDNKAPNLISPVVQNLTVLGTLSSQTIVVGGLDPNSAVITDSNGNLDTGLIDLESQVENILPYVNGGVGTNTPLFGGVLMQSTADQKIIETSITPSSVAVLPIDLNNQVTGINKIVQGGTNSNIPLTGNYVMQSDGTKVIESSVLISSLAVLPINLATEVGSSILKIANGGTNNSTALTGNYVMQSDGTKMKESSILISDVVTLPIDLVTEVGSSILKIVNGGTNSSTALTGNFLMQSDGSKIIETAIDPSTVAFLPINLLTEVKNALPVINGGTGSSAPLFNGYFMQSIGGNILESAYTPSSFITPPVNLATQVSGTLLVVNGGTGSNTALNNNRLMYSSGGKIIEAPALTNGQLFIGSTGGAPVAGAIMVSANLTNTLGSGTSLLDTIQPITTIANPIFNRLTLSATTGQLILGTSTTTTINSVAPVSSKVITIVDAGTSSNFVLSEGAMTINGVKTFSSAPILSIPLSISSGGTNSSTALVNTKIMVSSGGQIIEGTSSADPVFTSVFTSTIPAVVAEPYDLIPVYPLRANGIAVNAPSTTYTGCLYQINKPMIFTKINFSIVAGTTPGNMDLAIYQRSGGGGASTANPASLIAYARFVGATGGNIATITGSGILSPGGCYILYARNSGNQTVRCYSNQNFALFNGADLASGYAPVSFTTAIVSTATPASTFDPTTQTATTTDVALTCRLLA